MQKSTLLLVSGILLIIGAVFAIFGGIGILFLGGASAVLGAAGAGALFTLLGVITLASGIFNLVVGILGIKNHKSPEKAGTCMKLGIVMIVIQVIATVLSLATSGFSVSIVTGFLLPVLYYMGAKQLQDAA